MAIEDTPLYAAAFIKPRSDAPPSEQEFFRQQLLAMRVRVEPIVARILRDMPGYTVHDITHLDALWETASLLANEHLSLNPPEAFVFGAAVLLHDASMTLAAYPGGIEELKTLTEWKDFIAITRSSGKSSVDDAVVITNVLRILHAKNAEKLVTQGWPAPGVGYSEFLIQDNEVRRFYGPTIGQIAHSHWWPVAKVGTTLNSFLGPMPPQTRNEVDKLKIASLLRVADAIHLDRRRAPPFVRALDRPTGISALHWGFQSRLSFPRIEGDTLQFTAGEPCPIEESESWWLAYDAFALADRELRETNLMLCDQGRLGLKATRVKGVQNPRELARDVPVSGWSPVPSPFHVSDVSRIVAMLGGSKLYGDDWRAPLRELLQNAVDAIRARRLLQNNAKWGAIHVSLEDRSDGIWLVVEDDGVGMSEHVLTNKLVDFGTSLWRSAALSEEFPGLASKGMSSIGRFGIGFFSVFMIAKEVRVTTKRYDQASKDALVLFFNEGVHSRPILAPADPNSTPANGGTRVELKLIGDPRRKDGFQFVIQDRIETKDDDYLALLYKVNLVAINLLQAVKQIAPSADTTITVSDESGLTTAIEPNDWAVCDSKELLKRLVTNPSKILVNHLPGLMRPITSSSGMQFGRAAIWPSLSASSHLGALVSGGFRVQSLPHIAGLINGDVETAARNVGSPVTDVEAFSIWATEQAKLAKKSRLPNETLAHIAEIVLEFKGKIGGLPIAEWDGRWYTIANLQKAVKCVDELRVYVGDMAHEDDDEMSLDTFERNFEKNAETIFVPVLNSRFSFEVGKAGWRRSRRSHLRDVLESVVTSAWGKGWDWEESSETVGEVNHTDIVRGVTIYRKGG